MTEEKIKPFTSEEIDIFLIGLMNVVSFLSARSMQDIHGQQWIEMRDKYLEEMKKKMAERTDVEDKHKWGIYNLMCSLLLKGDKMDPPPMNVIDFTLGDD